MITDDYVKGYAIIKSGWLNKNILEGYIPFIATIIIDEHMETIDENHICKKLCEKYNAPFQVTFVRQILSKMVSKDIIVRERERFVVKNDRIKGYMIKKESFDYDLNLIISDFISYCNLSKYFPQEQEIKELILTFIEKYDDHVLYNNIGDIEIEDNVFLYNWCNYIIMAKAERVKQYEFILGMCSANLIRNALFYTGDSGSKVNLSVFLDTPMLFAIAGMDTEERAEAYKYLLKKASSAGMSLYMFDHNFEEAKGIMERASRWALSSNYDSSKANKVSSFFHDAGMDETEINEFINDFESVLNTFGITKCDSSYLAEENTFQIDEKQIYGAIKAEYGAMATKYNSQEQYDNSIKTDVRSLVMIQRKRAGSYSTDIKGSKYIFATTNNVVAKVSKDFAKKDELSKDKIPTAITADMFATLLWLDFPNEENNYLSYKMIADCKALLKPTATMIAKFNIALDAAYKRGEKDLSEDKFLFLRSHPIVKSALLDVTSGDYSQFTSNIWTDVYNRIKDNAQFVADRKYENEHQEHSSTKTKLESAKKTIKQKEYIISAQIETFSSIISNIIAIAIFAIPYVVLSLIIIFIQNEMFDWTIRGISLGIITVLIAILTPIFFKKLRKMLKNRWIQRLNNLDQNNNV